MSTPHAARAALALLLAFASLSAQSPVVREIDPSPKEVPSFAEVWKRHQAGKDVTEALRILRESDEAPKKDRFNAGYLSAVLELASGKSKEALELLDFAEKLVPGTPQVQLRRAEAHLQNKELKEAAALLKKSDKQLRRQKKSALYLRHELLEARMWAQQGKLDKAVKTLRRLVRGHRKSWELQFFLGKFSEAQDQPKPALEAYEKAIELLPERDPCIGVYALQRWAALAMSSDGRSYMNLETLKKAGERYELFLARAKANRVPPKLVQTVRQALGAVAFFKKKQQ